MFHWRITKYNPQYRDDKGKYLKDEWYLYSQIGQDFEGKTLTMKEYLKTEKAYVQAVLLFMKCLGLDSLRVSGLLKGWYAKKILTYKNVQIIDNADATKKQLAPILQLMLREEIRCKLESKEMYVHIGYDFYMYIGSTESCESTIKKIEQMGLYAEKIDKSPWQNDETDI